jgi:amino acid transporter
MSDWEGPSSSVDSGLRKEIRWWDGIVITACMPGFLLPSIGFSVGLLGGWGAVAVWIGIVTFGLLMANLYSELASMFPHRSGGIATYVDEAAHKWSRIPAVVSGYGYWFGYSTVLSINGILVGSYIQAAWLTNAHINVHGQDLFIPVVGSVMLILVWAVAIAGIRPTVWMTYALGALTMLPLTLVAITPWVTGHMHLSYLSNGSFPGANGGTGASFLSFAGLGIFFAMWYLGGWSAYAVESAAAFTPEYKHPETETPKALRRAGLIQILIFGLVPIALVGTVGQAVIVGAPYTAFVPVLQVLFGSFGSTLVLIMLLSALILSALISTADGGRALFQLARDGLTLRWLNHLNKQAVPDHGMTWDLVIQGLLMWFPYAAGIVGFSSLALNAPIVILAVSNLGYILCHVMAIATFIILRRQRPDMARPFKLSTYWLPIAYVLLIFNIIIIPIGAADKDLGYGLVPFILGVAVLLISVVLYYVRKNYEDPRAAASAAAAKA